MMRYSCRRPQAYNWCRQKSFAHGDGWWGEQQFANQQQENGKPAFHFGGGGGSAIAAAAARRRRNSVRAASGSTRWYSISGRLIKVTSPNVSGAPLAIL